VAQVWWAPTFVGRSRGRLDWRDVRNGGRLDLTWARQAMSNLLMHQVWHPAGSACCTHPTRLLKSNAAAVAAAAAANRVMSCSTRSPALPSPSHNPPPVPVVTEKCSAASWWPVYVLISTDSATANGPQRANSASFGLIDYLLRTDNKVIVLGDIQPDSHDNLTNPKFLENLILFPYEPAPTANYPETDRPQEQSSATSLRHPRRPSDLSPGLSDAPRLRR